MPKRLRMKSISQSELWVIYLCMHHVANTPARTSEEVSSWGHMYTPRKALPHVNIAKPASWRSSADDRSASYNCPAFGDGCFEFHNSFIVALLLLLAVAQEK